MSTALPYVVERHRDRASWLRARARGFGGSDAGVVWNVSHYSSRFALWARKRGVDWEDEGEREWLMIGDLLEPAIAELYRKRTRCAPLVDLGRTTILRSTRWPWLFATLDRVVPSRPDREGVGILECKNRGAYALRSWDEGVPLEILLQVQHGLAVTGLQWGSVAALLGGNVFRYVDVERDDELIELHAEACRELWAMVESGEQPEVDASESTGRALAALYARPTPGLVVALPDDALVWDRKLSRAKRLADRVAKVKDLYDHRLRQAIGKAEAGLLPDGSARLELRLVRGTDKRREHRRLHRVPLDGRRRRQTA